MPAELPSDDDGNRVQAKYRVFQTVYARDTDGVMYESVIRRRLYGQSQHKQVQLGLVASEHEAEELLSKEEEPTWHYYVHYNKWNVNWDRWVPEANVYEATDRIKAYADRLLTAHRALRAELTKKVKGKKGFQTVEGSEFLQRWRVVRARVDEEMRPDGDPPAQGDATAAPPEAQAEVPGSLASASSSSGTAKKVATAKKAESNPWTSSAEIRNEAKLRERRLTSVGCGNKGRQVQHQLILPFALKKCLVESWEVITQCGMVLELPAPVTVRQALDMYLQSKGISSDSSEEVDAPVAGDAPAPSDAAADANAADDDDSVARQRQLLDQQREWRDMADGIALMFDEALPDRLLYREEWPQFHVLCDHPDFATKRLSDLYGCEHLLRLFVRLPAILADELSESDARPVLAKVNDLARFLHKNQGSVLGQPYRKLTDVEEKERAKLTKKEEARRKRRLEAAAVAAVSPGEAEGALSKKHKAGALVEAVQLVMHQEPSAQ